MAILQEATSSSARLDGGSGVGWQYRLGRLVLLPLGFALAVLLAWELLCRTSRVSPVLLPPPSAVWSVLSGNWEILLQQSVPTTLEAIASFRRYLARGRPRRRNHLFGLGARGALS